MTRALRRALRAGAVLAAFGGMASAPLAAQAGGLERVDQLVLAGRAEEARAALVAWWDTADAADRGPPREQLQRALWLRGLLTVDPVQAALDYRRLVVEYPGGPWSDQALLRLARIEEARGDPARALGHLRVLLRDYPSSPHRLEAGELLERVVAAVAALPPEAPAAAPAEAAEPEPRAAPAAPDVEAEPPPREGEPAPERAPAAPPAETLAPWTVQVGAFASVERARALRDELRAAGIDARLATVPPSALLRVRAGRFGDEELAAALRRGLLARGYDATVSGDADREEAAP